MLRALFELWSNNEHVKVVVAEKLLKMFIVSNQAVVAWVFDPSLKSELVKMYLWELLNLTVRYTKYHMRDTEEHQNADLNCLLLNIVQTCVKVLMDHWKSEQGAECDYWFQWIQGRLLQLLFNYIDDVRNISSKLREIASEAEEAKSLSNMINDYLNYIR